MASNRCYWASSSSRRHRTQLLSIRFAHTHTQIHTLIWFLLKNLIVMQTPVDATQPRARTHTPHTDTRTDRQARITTWIYSNAEWSKGIHTHTHTPEEKKRERRKMRIKTFPTRQNSNCQLRCAWLDDDDSIANKYMRFFFSVVCLPFDCVIHPVVIRYVSLQVRRAFVLKRHQQYQLATGKRQW